VCVVDDQHCRRYTAVVYRVCSGWSAVCTVHSCRVSCVEWMVSSVDGTQLSFIVCRVDGQQCGQYTAVVYRVCSG
jgi:hypothetical protein